MRVAHLTRAPPPKYIVKVWGMCEGEAQASLRGEALRQGRTLRVVCREKPRSGGIGHMCHACSDEAAYITHG